MADAAGVLPAAGRTRFFGRCKPQAVSKAAPALLKVPGYGTAWPQSPRGAGEESLMYPVFFSFFCGPAFWLLMVVVFVVLELATTALVSVWFVAGSVVALLVSLITGIWWPQWLAFALVSVISQQLAKPLVARLRARRAPALNADRNVGRVATVLTPVGPGRQGRARLDGVDWNALCASPLEAGDSCLVLQVESTALVVAPMPKDPPPPEFFAQDGAAAQPAAKPAPLNAQEPQPASLGVQSAPDAGPPAPATEDAHNPPAAQGGTLKTDEAEPEPAEVSG